MTLARRSVLAALAGAPAAVLLAAAAPAASWTTIPVGARGSLLRQGSERCRTAYVFFPGANCTAARYAWLGALAGPDVAVYLFDPVAGGAFTITTVTDVLAALDQVRPHHTVLLGGGHSAGASAILDALDPVSARASPRDHLPEDYIPPQDVAGVAVMGCSLQAHVLTMVMSYRSEDRPLTRPHHAPLLFLAGDHDLIATPALTAKTCARFHPPAALTVLPGATHYGWTLGDAPTDRAAYNAPGGVAKDVQQAMTLARLGDWIAASIQGLAYG
jgi:hypothetical protein